MGTREDPAQAAMRSMLSWVGAFVVAGGFWLALAVVLGLLRG